MASTPLIKPISSQNEGIFYSFPSAIEDLQLSFNNAGRKFVFSKYALLRLPEIGKVNDPELNEKFCEFDISFSKLINGKKYEVNTPYHGGQVAGDVSSVIFGIIVTDDDGDYWIKDIIVSGYMLNDEIIEVPSFKMHTK